MDANEPALLKITDVNLDGKPVKRLFLALKTNGCAYRRDNHPCAICGFHKFAIPLLTHRISKSDLVAQLEQGLEWAAFQDIRQVDLLTPGSFFSRSEIAPEFPPLAMRRL